MPTDTICVGKIGAAWGIKGWLKVRSYTEPAENLFKYQPWMLNTPNGLQSFTIGQWHRHSKGFIAEIVGVDSREQAELLCNLDVSVEKNHLLPLGTGRYYWYQLQGLRVISRFNGVNSYLGTVKGLISTGANDVLVVKGDSNSVDKRERLIPYVTSQYIKMVNIDGGTMYVEWDPEF